MCQREVCWPGTGTRHSFLPFRPRASQQANKPSRWSKGVQCGGQLTVVDCICPARFVAYSKQNTKLAFAYALAGQICQLWGADLQSQDGRSGDVYIAGSLAQATRSAVHLCGCPSGGKGWKRYRLADEVRCGGMPSPRRRQASPHLHTSHTTLALRFGMPLVRTLAALRTHNG